MEDDVEEMNSPSGQDFESDDEEIDEEEAFNSEDEQQYGHIFENSRQDSDESIGGDENKATLLDVIDDGEESSDGVSDSDEDSEDASEDDESAHAKLMDVVDSLVSSDAADSELKKLVKEMNASGTRSGDAAGSIGHTKSKLTLESMMSSLKGSAQYGQLKKRLERLQDVEMIAEPLSNAIALRGERKAGYEVVQKEVSKWIPTIQKNRQAESLSFPLQGQNKIDSSTRTLTESFEVKTDLEKEIEAALLQSGLKDDEKIIADEERRMLKVQNLDPEEVKSRQAELSKLRALMFYSEQKAKRTKKIKSKLYRRLKKKRLAREDEKDLQKLREIDPEGARELEEQAALDRAKERMTLKHKNSSKFIKGLLKNGGAHRENSRQAILEHNEEGQRLKRKMDTMNDNSEDDDSSSDDDDEMTPEQRLKRQAQSNVDQIDKDVESNGEVKGIFGLKFMQRGLQKQHAEAKEQAERLLRQVENDEIEQDDEDKDEAIENVGRKKMGPKGGVSRIKLSNISESKSVDVSKTEKKSMFTVPDYGKPQPKLVASVSSNPWLQGPRKENTKTQDKVHVEIIKSLLNNPADDASKEKRKEQAKLIKRAFAGSNALEEDFVMEKEEEELEEDERKRRKEQTVKDLPGWGDWTGAGVAPPKKSKKLPAEENPKKRKAMESSGLKHVVVCKKRNKKGAKYLVAGVPYPFTSKEQYEHSLRNPIGNDWNTLGTFNKSIKPEVIVRAGAIIDPIEKPEEKSY